ncbi:EcsC family protein [Metabacillus arenae]|uniref:EcsC family protein n=1 Tax=Metabacillus arenae TaxID=2771434 RepID=A0A926N9P2_9BACI|nr:EcsC family protein [Metabacillus arenae]MBD1379334.1 EcsC family protein [Metabacillus arenae]
MQKESRELLLEKLKLIEKWENDQQGLWFWEKIGRIPFKILDKLTPAFIQKKIGVLLDELGSFIQTGGQYLTQEKMIFNKVQKYTADEISEVKDISNVPLVVMNSVSDDLKRNRKNLATAQGATTGFGGLFTLAIDIPVLLGLSLKTLQEISIAYGYDPKEKAERIFIVKCLQFASADYVGKQSVLKELSNFYDRRKGQSEIMSQLQGWREVVYTYRDHFGWKKLLQMVPIAGMIFGAYANRTMIQDLSEAGIMLYQKRRIMDRLNELEEEKTNEKEIENTTQ